MKYIQNESCNHIVVYLFNVIYMETKINNARRVLSPYIPRGRKDIIANIEKMVDYYA